MDLNPLVTVISNIKTKVMINDILQICHFFVTILVK